MSKKKVLYIHHGQGIGGAPLSLLYLIQALDKTQYEPVVLFLQYSEVMDLYRAQGITVYGPVTRSDFAHTKIWWYRWYHVAHLARAIFDTIALVRGEAEQWLTVINPDIVHLNTSSLVAWGYAAKKMGIPVVWHIREPLAPGYFGLRKKFIEHMVGHHAQAILPICKNDALPWHDNAKTTVVYNAVPAEKFSPALAGHSLYKANGVLQKLEDDAWAKEREEPERVPTILFLGGLSEEKGTLLLFEVFEKVLEIVPTAKLLVAGKFDTSLVTSQGFALRDFFPTAVFYHKVGKQLEKIKNSVTFLGIAKNVPELMAQADCLVFPATVGHFARPIIEAGFMAKPVVASALAPMDELVVDGVTGFLVAPENKELWAQKIIELLTNKELADTMGKAAYDFATEKFSVAHQISLVEGVYRSLL